MAAKETTPSLDLFFYSDTSVLTVGGSRPTASLKSYQITLFFHVSRPMSPDPIKRNYGKILIEFSKCNWVASAQPTPSSLLTGQNGSDRLLHSRYCGVPPKIKQWSDISLWGQITHDKVCLNVHIWVAGSAGVCPSCRGMERRGTPWIGLFI